MSTENVELVNRVLEESRSDPTALWAGLRRGRGAVADHGAHLVDR